MKSTFTYISLALCFLFGGIYLFNQYPTLPVFKHKEGAMEEQSKERLRWFYTTLADPNTGKIPEQIHTKELAFVNRLPGASQFGKSYGFWVQRGPHNIGGRTRAIAFDRRNEQIILAGAASGGIWFSHDGGQSWYPTNINNENPNITCLVQDPRTGHEDEWYAGTGELYGGTLPGAFYSGNGIYKSSDAGKTWSKHTTFTTTPGGITSDWSAIFNMVINKTVDSAANLFVATFNGIYRSVDGGKNWQKKRGGGITGSSYFTDVAITNTGIVYAALSFGSTQQGIWRSADNGNTWTNITPTFYPTDCGRLVMGIAPSDQNTIYFAAHTPTTGKVSLNFEGTEERNSFWKYTYVSGNGSGAGGVWEDRSANLPDIGGHFGDFVSQSGYCLDIKVKPDDANTVFLGGTNLYRSRDAFATGTKTTWIGGYAEGTAIPDFKIYNNHHPDQHGVLFYPSNPQKMISVHDGGISRTQNSMSDFVSWESLNRGYVTTQFYTVAINKQTTDQVLLGGLQDNGTLITSTDNNLAPWTLPLSYDGAWCYISPDGSEYYMSIQQGRISRIKLDANNNPVQFARLNPTGVSKSVYQFINPFTPDAHNWKKLFLPAGSVMWRNDDVTVKPLKNEFDTTTSLVNWNELTNTKLSGTDEITAVLSSSIQTDVLYYGTLGGKLFRLRNASDNQSVPEDIKGAGFPAAYINCIAQHPTDSSKLYVVFTNYGVLSVFYTENSGQTWVPVSGNLEENASGTGNGPSCRWFTPVPVGDSLIYYLGTSTGLYATTTLNGMQTVWEKQSPDRIGNNIIMMMQHRTTDGLLAVATYGAGMFTTKINSLTDNTGITSKQVTPRIKGYPNPVTNGILYFDIKVSAEVYDMAGKLVARSESADFIHLGYLPRGLYYLRIKGQGESIQKVFIQ